MSVKGNDIHEESWIKVRQSILASNRLPAKGARRNFMVDSVMEKKKRYVSSFKTDKPVAGAAYSQRGQGELGNV